MMSNQEKTGGLLRGTTPKPIRIRLIWGTPEGEKIKNILQSKLDIYYQLCIENDFKPGFFETKDAEKIFTIYTSSTEEIVKTWFLISANEPSAIVVCDQASLDFLAENKITLKRWLKPNLKLIALGFEPDLSELDLPTGKLITHCPAGVDKTEFLPLITPPLPTQVEPNRNRYSNCTVM